MPQCVELLYVSLDISSSASCIEFAMIPYEKSLKMATIYIMTSRDVFDPYMVSDHDSNLNSREICRFQK